MEEINKNAYIVSGVVVAALILLGFLYFGKKQEVAVPVPTPTVAGNPSPTAVSSGTVVAQITITYTDSGFSPDSIRIQAGTPVTFVNKGSRTMWVASTPHPVHTDLPGFDQLTSVPNGGSYTYIFDKVGSWKYHNHMRSADSGMVVVE